MELSPEAPSTIREVNFPNSRFPSGKNSASNGPVFSFTHARISFFPKSTVPRITAPMQPGLSPPIFSDATKGGIWNRVGCQYCSSNSARRFLAAAPPAPPGPAPFSAGYHELEV